MPVRVSVGASPAKEQFIVTNPAKWENSLNGSFQIFPLLSLLRLLLQARGLHYLDEQHVIAFIDWLPAIGTMDVAFCKC